MSSEVEEAALRAGAQGVLQHRGRVMSQAGEPFCRAAGVAAAAMTETAPEGFAGTFPEACLTLSKFHLLRVRVPVPVSGHFVLCVTSFMLCLSDTNFCRPPSYSQPC